MNDKKVSWGYCLIYAVKMWIKHGGYLVFRRTLKTRKGLFKYILLPHALWCPNAGCEKLKQFVPIKDFKICDWIPLLWLFKGQVKEGDEDYKRREDENK